MKKKIVKLTIGLSFAISLLVLIYDYTSTRTLSEYTLTRSEQGTGTREETLSYHLEDGSSGDVTLTIPEATYSSGEAGELLKEACLTLDEIILGDNDSFTHITSPMNLVTSLLDNPTMITWNSSRMEILDYEGLPGTDIPKDGAEVVLSALLTLQEESTEYQRTVRVYPQTLTGLKEQITAKTQSLNKNRQGNLYYLPDELEGKEIQWQTKASTQGITLLFLSALMVALLFLAEKEQAHRRKEKRTEQLMEDYSEIVSKLLLLLSAGLSVRNAFERIVNDYMRAKGNSPGATRVAYEEMAILCRKLSHGTPEAEAYESFGKVCNCPSYKTLSTLLCQNLKKGSSGIKLLLEHEVQEAFEERKRRAKIKGDKAGTQLLLPMVCMLGIVLVIVIFPAFLSFSS